MDRRSRDPLTAAATQVLRPALAPLGFTPYKGRAFVCCRGDILHYLGLQLSAWGSKQFAVNYTAMPLFPPTAYVYLPCGGRLRQGKSPDRWWSAATHEQADKSMARVVEAAEDQLHSFFRRTSTYAGLADELGTVDNPHSRFGKACCEVKAGLRDAHITLAEAVTQFRRVLVDSPASTWADARLSEAAALARAMDDGSEQRLLVDWARATATALKVQRGKPAA